MQHVDIVVRASGRQRDSQPARSVYRRAKHGYWAGAQAYNAKVYESSSVNDEPPHLCPVKSVTSCNLQTSTN